LSSSALWGGKLTFQDRVELTRGLTAEYATAKALIPHTRKTLEFDSNGTFDAYSWSKIAQASGPAARPGDLVQVTKIEILSDRIVLQINGGYSGGLKWYRNVQVGAGPSSNPVMGPIAPNDTNAPGGAAIALMFHHALESIKADDVKKMLAPILDFEKHSAAEVYAESLPPAVRQAVKEGRVVVGMDRDQVILAMGRPAHRSRETRDGVEYEDWVYGQAPGKFTFVTFKGDKVVAVKEDYAGLGALPPDPK
jgi:hypothetical protein